MAYYNLYLHPKDAIKSKSNGGKSFINLTNFQPSDSKAIGEDWDVQPGDVISWGDYRAVDTYFVDQNRRLLKNQDNSGSGYLTIPLSITRLFPSALKHYESLLENVSSFVSSIELAPTDGIFEEKFGSPLPEYIRNRHDIWYEYSPVEMVLFISIGKKEAQTFPLDETKTKDIVDYVSVANENDAAFIVDYDIQNEEAYRKWPGHLKPGLLPAGWFCTQYGTVFGEYNHMRGAIKIQGPKKFKDAAYQIAQKYYDEFGVTMTWQTN